MSPRQHLQKHPATEKAGSPKIKALSDMATLRYAEQRLSEIMGDESVAADHEMLKLFYQQVAVSETIRKRRFGKHGAQYNKVREEFEEIARPYYENQGEEHPAKRMMEDLEEINNGKSLKEEMEKS